MGKTQEQQQQVTEENSNGKNALHERPRKRETQPT